jgi:hypothetical protein
MMIFFLVITLTSFIGIIACYRMKPTKTEHDTHEINSLYIPRDEFIRVTNFLLLYNIITLEEYNKIQENGLPYTG